MKMRLETIDRFDGVIFQLETTKIFSSNQSLKYALCISLPRCVRYLNRIDQYLNDEVTRYLRAYIFIAEDSHREKEREKRENLRSVV